MTIDRRLLHRVVLRNYKSIAACDVSLAQLSFLVGPNGSGKSNFLDALRFVADALRFSIDHAQILVTSHSPDLLDDDDISEDSIFAVVAEHGETRIGPLDDVGRAALRDHLYTAGELLRMNQLEPDPARSRLKASQLELFGSNP